MVTSRVVWARSRETACRDARGSVAGAEIFGCERIATPRAGALSLCCMSTLTCAKATEAVATTAPTGASDVRDFFAEAFTCGGGIG